MLRITWKSGEVPAGLPVTQVYGLVFDREGRMLLIAKKRKTGTVYGMAGGTPEVYDRDREATLRRELLEEVNTVVGDVVIPIGYQLVEGDGSRAPYAQMRMVAMIESIGECRPDPDNGETYDRLLVSPCRAITLLGWGKIAEEQIGEAVRIARAHFGIPDDVSAPDLTV